MVKKRVTQNVELESRTAEASDVFWTRFQSRSHSTVSSCWESIFRADTAFPGVFYWDRVQSVQLIMSAFKCPKVFGWKLLETLKKCLIITVPCPEHRLGSWKFKYLWRSLGQNVSRPEPSCDFKWQEGQLIVKPPPKRIMVRVSEMPCPDGS